MDEAREDRADGRRPITNRTKRVMADQLRAERLARSRAQADAASVAKRVKPLARDELGPQAWRTVDGRPGWLVLMYHGRDYAEPRLVTGPIDEVHLLMCVRARWPGCRVETTSDGLRTYVVRQEPTHPAPHPASCEAPQ